MIPWGTSLLKEGRAAVVVASPSDQLRKRILNSLPHPLWLVEEARGGAEALAMM